MEEENMSKKDKHHKIRRKRNIEELKGLVKLPYKTNSVKLKKELY